MQAMPSWCALCLLLVFAWGVVGLVAEPAYTCDSVDVVYTWVNGSDPVHIANLVNVTLELGKKPSIDSPRFRDYETLRYSMRSIVQFMPWANTIWLVTSGHVPGWLDVSHPRVRLVTHEEIMPTEHLPTFNSNGIELHLAEIEGIAPCFLYLNDDMLLSRPATLDEYWDQEKGLPVAHVSKTWFAPMRSRMRTNSWHRSVANTDKLITRALYPGHVQAPKPRPYAVHGCYFFHRDILLDQAKRYREAFDATSSRPFRGENDVTLAFLFINDVMERFPQTPVEPYGLSYLAFSRSARKNQRAFDKVLAEPRQCLCLNDGLGKLASSYREKRVKNALEGLRTFMHTLYPEPAPWELDAAVNGSMSVPMISMDVDVIESVEGEWRSDVMMQAVIGCFVSIAVLVLCCSLCYAVQLGPWADDYLMPPPPHSLHRDPDEAMSRPAEAMRRGDHNRANHLINRVSGPTTSLQ